MTSMVSRSVMAMALAAAPLAVMAAATGVAVPAAASASEKLFTDSQVKASNKQTVKIRTNTWTGEREYRVDQPLGGMKTTYHMVLKFNEAGEENLMLLASEVSRSSDRYTHAMLRNGDRVDNLLSSASILDCMSRGCRYVVTTVIGPTHEQIDAATNGDVIEFMVDGSVQNLFKFPRAQYDALMEVSRGRM